LFLSFVVFGSIKQIIDIWYTIFHMGLVLYIEKHIL
jgi:hypothetical protein